MKLSEAKFRPMFLRLVEWASSASSIDDMSGLNSGAAPIARIVTLFGAANFLTERLRSVFVPYYRYIMDLAVTHLGGSGRAPYPPPPQPPPTTNPSPSPSSPRYIMDLAVTHLGGSGKGGQPKKKAKKSASAIADMGQEQKDIYEEESVVLRCRVVRALHRCFLYDSVTFLDQDRFERLLPALVSHLDIEPPAHLSKLLASQNSDKDLDASVKLGKHYEHYDTMGVAVVGCLAQMAVDANSDALWKPLNHQVLMMTRSASVRTKVLSLEVVAQLVDRLREEYLVLLPETIPFLAELLEDSELAVEARAQQVVKALEEVSGEKLDQYMSVK
eukprot:gene13554-19425_t